MEASRDATAESTLRLVEEGCIEAYTQAGGLICLETLRQICAASGGLPPYIVLVITDKGRDVLARGLP